MVEHCLQVGYQVNTCFIDALHAFEDVTMYIIMYMGGGMT